MPVSCRLPKIAARRFITPSERLLSISTLHQAQVEAYNGKLAVQFLSVSSTVTDTVSRLWDLEIVHVS